MEIKKKIKVEKEEEIIEKTICDNCESEIPTGQTCGFGTEFTLSDAWCFDCGGKRWEFCSYKCLKEFVNVKLLEHYK